MKIFQCPYTLFNNLSSVQKSRIIYAATQTWVYLLRHCSESKPVKQGLPPTSSLAKCRLRGLRFRQVNLFGKLWSFGVSFLSVVSETAWQVPTGVMNYTVSPTGTCAIRTIFVSDGASVQRTAALLCGRDSSRDTPCLGYLYHVYYNWRLIWQGQRGWRLIDEVQMSYAAEGSWRDPGEAPHPQPPFLIGNKKEGAEKVTWNT